MSFSIPPDQLSAFAEFPAATPPPGVKANFTNPESQATLSLVIGAVSVGIMTFFVAARLCVKAFIIGKATWDDRKLQSTCIEKYH